MTLPHTYLAALLLTLLSMICWGSCEHLQNGREMAFRAVLLRFCDRRHGWRPALRLHLGTMGFDGFLFRDDLMHTAAGKCSTAS